MCLLLVDQYSNKIVDLENKIYKNSAKTFINELVSDLIRSIKEDDPPLPDMSDNKIFKFYFDLYNKEYGYDIII